MTTHLKKNDLYRLVPYDVPVEIIDIKVDGKDLFDMMDVTILMNDEAGYGWTTTISARVEEFEEGNILQKWEGDT